MANYIQLLFENISIHQSDILVAELSDAGFEGFEEDPHSLRAFIDIEKFDERTAREIAEKWQLNFSKSEIIETNWNQVWESGFQPVVIDDFVSIRAGFHEPVKTVQHELIITPKMSFGTGHHATTWLMISQMRSIDFNNKSVFDFGTGTGVLAILAIKLGASLVTAIDYDEWSITNCRENILQNQVSSIEVRKSDRADINGYFDVILANINKNVILDNLMVLAKQLNPGGVLLLSGLLVEDEEEMTDAAKQAGLQLLDKVDRHNWLCLKLSHK